MSLKTREPNKMFIEQFIINGITDFDAWVQENLNILLTDNHIIGYYFGTKESTSFNEDIEILNLYLIDRRHCYCTEVIYLEKLKTAWTQFKCSHNKIFNNPPIDVWLDSKDSWCNMIATNLSKKYNCTFSEALSTIYYAIMKCYNKPGVYMGNLNYIRSAVINTFLVDYRFNKIRVNQDSGLAISLSTVINNTDDNEILTLENCIAAPESTGEDSIDYKDLLNTSIKLLSDTFSLREIDLIINTKPTYMPENIYNRLLKWRQKHSIKEIYETK